MALPERSTVVRVLAHVNEARAAKAWARRAALKSASILLGELPNHATLEQIEEHVDQALGRPSRRLAAYGSLRPGQANHREVAGLGGRWTAGRIRGRYAGSSRATGGYPAFAPDPHGELVDVELLDSLALPDAWARLDAFEGASYRRELALVELADGASCVANLYVPARR